MVSVSVSCTTDLPFDSPYPKYVLLLSPCSPALKNVSTAQLYMEITATRNCKRSLAQSLQWSHKLHMSPLPFHLAFSFPLDSP